MTKCKLCFIGPLQVKCDEKIQPKLFPLVTWGREEGSFVQVLAGNRVFLFLTIIDRSRLSGFLIIMMKKINKVMIIIMMIVNDYHSFGRETGCPFPNHFKPLSIIRIFYKSDNDNNNYHSDKNK